MKIKNPGFQPGYSPITKLDDLPWDDPKNPQINFGVLVLEPKSQYILKTKNEKSALLMKGAVKITYWVKGQEKETLKANRGSIFDENPTCILVSRDYILEFTTESEPAELILSQTPNEKSYIPRIFMPKDCQSENRGAGAMRETSTRVVRTIYDFNNCPESNLVLGEVINYPGKWSSYPPHGHPQPEIYHYRFLPEQGFGLGMMGYEDVVSVKNGDTIVITDGVVHSQTAAPGYAMYYAWAIRHLDGKPWTSFEFDPDHTWVMDPKNDSKIWPYPK
jgi:5-deoxy-glucuronate isomerase